MESVKRQEVHVGRGVQVAERTIDIEWICRGGPGNSTRFFAFYLFDNAFQYFRMGYASAMAWILFVVLALATYFLFRSSRYWVHYQEKLR